MARTPSLVAHRKSHGYPFARGQPEPRWLDREYSWEMIIGIQLIENLPASTMSAGGRS